MRIGVGKNKKKIFVHALKKNTEIHPLWLRERVTNIDCLDKNNGQRLYDPSEIKKNLRIKSALIKKNFLNVQFNDGVKTEFIIKDILINTKDGEKHFQEKVKALTLSDFQLLFNKTNLKIKDIFGDFQLRKFNAEKSERLIIIGTK